MRDKRLFIGMKIKNIVDNIFRYVNIFFKFTFKILENILKEIFLKLLFIQKKFFKRKSYFNKKEKILYYSHITN